MLKSLNLFLYPFLFFLMIFTYSSQSFGESINMENKAEIYFAGGCFWGVEEFFSRIKGVINVTSGYANGKTENPTYKEVCSGLTGHAETTHVIYDPSIISLETLTIQFFKIIDPISLNKQGNDIGTQYRTGIYFVNDKDKEILINILNEEQKKYDKKIVVEIMPLKNYYLAEDYHQDYLKKNPRGYCHISFESLQEIQ